MNTTTRRQIRLKGATQYLARKITQSLSPKGKEGQSLTYSVPEILQVVKNTVDYPKTHKTTIETLKVIEQWLLSIESNVILFPTSRVTLSEKLRRTRQSVVNLRADIAKASR
jgi:hypothetical protein